jgi:iron(III) transport system substrate-binding protein
LNHKLLLFLCILCVLCDFSISGCEKNADERVTLYTSVDEPIAGPIVRDFEKETGIHVTLVTDTEASKSVGLAERLRAEKSNPQADVWWGNEPFHTINLAEEGLLQPYDSLSAKDVAARYKDPEHRWAGNGLRARVLARSTRVDRPGSRPPTSSIELLAHPALKGQVAMARPTAGTTGGHVAALFVLWGDPRAIDFCKKLRANNIKLLGGNSAVAEAVGNGTALLGLTDNDDVEAARREGGQLEAVLPNQDSFGTLMLPTTVGLVRGTRRSEAARKLVDYLLSAPVEKRLIDAKFAGWSVRDDPTKIKVEAMDVDYTAVARAMPGAVRRATAILEGRDE